MRILVIGAGGHGEVVADILESMADAGQDLEVVGFLDDNPAITGERRRGILILGSVDMIARCPHDAVILAIGDNRARRDMAEALSGETFAVACHPRAVIAKDVVLEPGAMVSAGAVVNTGSRICSHAIVNTAATLDHHGYLGPFAHLAPGVHAGGCVAVGAGAMVGISAAILPQRVIGEWSIVAAGAVVTRDVPGGATVVGIPARRVAPSCQENVAQEPS